MRISQIGIKGIDNDECVRAKVRARAFIYIYVKKKGAKYCECENKKNVILNTVTIVYNFTLTLPIGKPIGIMKGRTRSS